MKWEDILARIKAEKDHMKRRAMAGKLMVIYKVRVAQLNEIWNEGAGEDE